MKFRFPVVIIDEDFRSENASGLGIRALAAAIEKEGLEVLGVTSYYDLSQYAQQQSRASAFILSIDDEEFGAGTAEETDKALKSLRAFVEEIRFKNADIPIYLYGETRTSPATSFAKPRAISIRSRRRFSGHWSTTRRTARTPGIARGTRAAWRS
jgi:arginine decarboxylase